MTKVEEQKEENKDERKPPLFQTFRALGKELGFSHGYLYKLANRGVIPSYGEGRTKRGIREEVIAALRRKK